MENVAQKKDYFRLYLFELYRNLTQLGSKFMNNYFFLVKHFTQ